MYRGLTVMLASVILATASLPAQTGSIAAPVSQPGAAPAPPSIATRLPTNENWTTIHLADSGVDLKAVGGVLLSKIELPGCIRELRRLQWRPNDPIDLYIIRPSGADKPPVVLFLYNYTYDTDLFRADRWCDMVRQNGFAAIGFGSALSPQRIRPPRPLKEWFVSQLQEALASSTQDVQMVLNYLETRGDLDMQGVGMFGQGSGGAVAILAAAADPRITALDLMDPWGDWPDWLKGSQQIPEDERAAYLQPDFLAGVANLDPMNYLPRLKDRALRVQEVMDDPVTPAAAREKLAAAVPKPGDVQRYADRDAEAKALGTNGIVGWLSERVHFHGAHSIARKTSRLQYYFGDAS